MSAEAVSPDAKLPEPASQPQAETAAPNAEAKESQGDINWRKAREAMKREKQEKEEANRKAQAEADRAAQKEAEVAALKAALESVVKRPDPEQSEEKSQEQIIDDRIHQALAAERKRNDDAQKKREIDELPNRITQAFPDYSQIVSEENVAYLKVHRPEIWAGYKNAIESIETYAGLYDAIKKHVPLADAKKEAAKIDKNLSKPQSMAQAGMAATGDVAPHKLDDKKKQDNWLRMRKAMKGI
jgi:hypothetical protein